MSRIMKLCNVACMYFINECYSDVNCILQVCIHVHVSTK